MKVIIKLVQAMICKMTPASSLRKGKIAVIGEDMDTAVIKAPSPSSRIITQPSIAISDMDSIKPRRPLSICDEESIKEQLRPLINDMGSDKSGLSLEENLEAAIAGWDVEVVAGQFVDAHSKIEAYFHNKRRNFLMEPRLNITINCSDNFSYKINTLTGEHIYRCKDVIPRILSKTERGTLVKMPKLMLKMGEDKYNDYLCLNHEKLILVENLEDYGGINAGIVRIKYSHNTSQTIKIKNKQRKQKRGRKKIF